MDVAQWLHLSRGSHRLRALINDKLASGLFLCGSHQYRFWGARVATWENTLKVFHLRSLKEIGRGCLWLICPWGPGHPRLGLEMNPGLLGDSYGKVLWRFQRFLIVDISHLKLIFLIENLCWGWIRLIWFFHLWRPLLRLQVLIRMQWTILYLWCCL